MAWVVGDDLPRIFLDLLYVTPSNGLRRWFVSDVVAVARRDG